MAWLWFIWVQLKMAGATLMGLAVLAPPCYLHSWTTADTPSIKPGRGPVDRWTSPWLQSVYGNPEDGVSGQQAVVSGAPYLPTASPGWRAYSWSALRNSADQLKYKYAWPDGPLVKHIYTLFGRTHEFKVGWQPENGYKVPVLSLW